MAHKDSTSERPKIAVLAAGGTGGHMFPAEALARELKSRGWQVILATDARGETYAHSFPADQRMELEAATFTSKNPFALLGAGLKIVKGIGQAWNMLSKVKPNIVVGFGGYPSFPTLMAAIYLKVPTLLHEQNAVLGKTNRALADQVTRIACAFPTLKMISARAQKKAAMVGNPTRPEIAALAEQPYPPLNDKIRILITGGSQGARLLSEMVPEAMARLPDPLRARLVVEQQTRPESLDHARQIYLEAGIEAHLAPFFRDMARRIGEAHLVIGRAGASTVTELAVAGRPAIFVPLKIAADDHQTYNAELLRSVDAADVINEDTVDVEALTDLLVARLADLEGLKARAERARAQGRPHATLDLAAMVEQTAR